VQEADDVIDVVAIEQDLGVGAVGQLAQYDLPVVIDVDGGDLAARDHDVLHRHLVEIQDAYQHLLVVLGNEIARLVDDGAQLFGIEGVILVVLETQEFQQQVRDAVDEPDKGANGTISPLRIQEAG
jgi:hypothetical protein